MPNTPKGLTYPSSSSPVAVPADIQELATDVDGLIVPNTGGTYTGSVSFTQSPSVPTPTSSLHAVNKTYADLINTDVTALETELGTNPSGTFSTVVQRLDSYTDGFNKVGNLLTENQASGTDTLAATTGFDNGGSGAVLATTTAQARQGSRSLQVTASGGGNGTFFTGVAGAAAGAVPVTAGATYTAAVSLRSAATTAPYGVSIAWLDSGGGYISLSASTSGTTSTSAWTDVTVTAVAPASAAYAAVGVAMTAAASSVHYADALGLWRGVGGTFVLPGYPVVGQSHIATNGAVQLSGTGSPEGVVVAAPGSTFLQTDSVVDVKGWIRWIKSTGTGNTGWIPGPEADTGWRAVTPGIAMFDVVHRLNMRRRGTTVTVVGRLQSTAGGSPWGDIVSLPDGWRCVDYTAKGIGNLYDTTVGGYQPFVLTSLGSTTLLSTIQPRGGSATVGPNSSIEFEVSWTVDNAWPTSLPGSAA